MKTDVLTKVVIVFALGVLASSVGFTEVFHAEASEPLSALHQGIATR